MRAIPYLLVTWMKLDITAMHKKMHKKMPHFATRVPLLVASQGCSSDQHGGLYVGWSLGSIITLYYVPF